MKKMILVLLLVAPLAGQDLWRTSWYGPGFHGRQTASCEIYDMNELTCAHRWLPFETRLLLVNPLNGRSVIARVNDRGPYFHGRDLDVSLAVAQHLMMVEQGIADLMVRRLSKIGERK